MTESLDKEKPKEKEKVESKPSKLIAYPQICAVENDDSTGFDIEELIHKYVLLKTMIVLDLI